MEKLRIVVARLRGLFLRRSVEREMNEELRLHIEMRARENMRRGMTEEEARRAAERSFGNLARVKEACRDVKGGGVIETLLQDLRYGARTLFKNRGFIFVVILTLALATGANTAIFSVVDAVLLRPLPFGDPERLVALRETLPDEGAIPVAYRTYAEWRGQWRSYF